MTSDSLAQLSLRLRQFAAARAWAQFHSPKNLVMALTAEAGELAAEFQWLEGPQSQSLDDAQLERVRNEAADVLNYLVQLADRLNFDLVAAANAKIDVNEQRYPANQVHGSAKKYNQY